METPSQGLMKCCACGLLKPFSEMTRANANRCKPCENAYAREWRKRNPEAFKAYYTQWRAKNRAKLKEQAKARRQKLDPERLAQLKEHERAKTKRLTQALKDAAYESYGGYRCSCCGETERLFLSIDHIENNGAEMRKLHGYQPATLYRWLKNNGYPKGFQVLCMNCNVGKHRNGGVCPHQARCNDYPERE